MTAPGATHLNVSAGIASVTVAAVLVALKFWAFVATGSLSVAASVADSALDLMVSLGGLAAILYAARPPDDDHAFGHSSAEDLAALAQALFITVSGLAIGWAAVLRLTAPSPMLLKAQGPGMVVMAVSIAATLALVAWQRRVARVTGNRVVRADQLHYIGDLLPNIGAFLALAISARWGFNQIDSLVAIAAAALMVFGALHIGKGAWDALMDRGVDPRITRRIEALTADWPGVRGYHDIKTRSAGSRFFVQIHIELDGGQTLAEAHEISAGLKRAIIDLYPEADVIIHKDVAR
ncbi:iron transporter [Defluviimonas sp. 20V17]|uniref:ABC transporter permease n=1 Tax=Allgaiera indica TaxID=765699 RepID=A0AAN4URQ9_9RHOB|nr:cation diffusion facilitator family transporter [Allgaiera indica]KDB02372.1 iron transporter [Defluviimonas sp. 20V17]GHE02247.1 ABC transporter permease [Allgaiera indica]SDX07279.1 ferrous-iron efflux pump FieF [Allgaiera indica]